MPEETKIIQVAMPAELIESSDQMLQKQDISRSALIREARAKCLTSTEEAERLRLHRAVHEVP
jgi:metal-responsive CopG/Arc/MetJ family transcriptional regulator